MLPDQLMTDSRFDELLMTVQELARSMGDMLQSVMPSRASVEFGVGFVVRSGRLTSVLVDNKEEAALTIRLDWTRNEPAVPR